MKRAALVTAALALATIGAGARPECAFACTCAPLRPGPALEQADAAFVGRLLERRDAASGATLVLVGERRLKGPLGDRVVVETAASPAGCGITAPQGTRMVLFLTRDGEVWRGSVCGQGPPGLAASLPTAASGEDVADSFAEATAYVLAIVALAAVGVFLLRRRFGPD